MAIDHEKAYADVLEFLSDAERELRNKQYKSAGSAAKAAMNLCYKIAKEDSYGD